MDLFSPSAWHCNSIPWFSPNIQIMSPVMLLLPTDGPNLSPPPSSISTQFSHRSWSLGQGVGRTGGLLLGTGLRNWLTFHPGKDRFWRPTKYFLLTLFLPGGGADLTYQTLKVQFWLKMQLIFKTAWSKILAKNAINFQNDLIPNWFINLPKDSENAEKKIGFSIGFWQFTMGRANLPPPPGPLHNSWSLAGKGFK